MAYTKEEAKALAEAELIRRGFTYNATKLEWTSADSTIIGRLSYIPANPYDLDAGYSGVQLHTRFPRNDFLKVVGR